MRACAAGLAWLFCAALAGAARPEVTAVAGVDGNARDRMHGPPRRQDFTRPRSMHREEEIPFNNSSQNRQLDETLPKTFDTP